MIYLWLWKGVCESDRQTDSHRKKEKLCVCVCVHACVLEKSAYANVRYGWWSNMPKYTLGLLVGDGLKFFLWFFTHFSWYYLKLRKSGPGSSDLSLMARKEANTPKKGLTIRDIWPFNVCLIKYPSCLWEILNSCKMCCWYW